MSFFAQNICNKRTVFRYKHHLSWEYNMAEKKQSYTEEELNEMIAWFNDHANQHTKTMQINKSAFTPDLVLTIESCIMQAKQNLGNYKMEGSFLLLRQIRANIEKGENDLL